MPRRSALAIRITEANREKIAIMNNGVVPECEENNTFFVVDEDFTVLPTILSARQFERTYKFIYPVSDKYFVDCVAI